MHNIILKDAQVHHLNQSWVIYREDFTPESDCTDFQGVSTEKKVH